MKNVSLATSLLLLVTLSFILYSCEQELIPLENEIEKLSIVQVNEEPQLVELVNHFKLAKSTKFKNLNLTEALKGINPEGEVSYSFLFKNDDKNTAKNLVVSNHNGLKSAYLVYFKAEEEELNPNGSYLTEFRAEGDLRIYSLDNQLIYTNTTEDSNSSIENRDWYCTHISTVYCNAFGCWISTLTNCRWLNPYDADDGGENSGHNGGPPGNNHSGDPDDPNDSNTNNNDIETCSDDSDCLPWEECRDGICGGI